jgi:hypothetical protein
MLGRLCLALLTLALLVAAPASARTPLFDDEAPIAITVTGPLAELVRAAGGAPKPYPAALTVTDGAGAPKTFTIQLQARGISRRTRGYCRFPPLWLKFDKAEVRDMLFAHQKKLKLVTYCRPAPGYDQHIVLEYLAYRLYSLVTPVSYRVRPAEVTYREGAADPGITRFGFLIEDIGDVAVRNGREELTAKSHEVSQARLDAQAAARATLFEYMIGNLDWEFLAGPPGAGCCHNGRLLAAPGAKAATAAGVVPVPYDYDSSGFVDAPYAEPPEGMKITDRFYHRYCATRPALGAVIDEFRARRQAMLALVENEPHLDAAFRDKAERYLQSFFAELDDPSRVKRDIIDHCR